MELNYLKGFLSDVEKLQQAQELLEEIWCELDPYNNSLSRELNRKIHSHFDFDDSE